jgi:hypothetical protein
MTPQTKKVVVITISLLSLAGLSYFAYTYFKKKKEEDVLPTPSDTIPTTTPTTTTTTTTSGTTNTLPPINVENATSGLKPLSNAEIVGATKGFQNWMDAFNPNWLNDGTNINKSTAKGYGRFGTQTKKAVSNLSNAKGFASYLLKNGYNVNSLKRIAMWLSTQGVNFPMAV